MSMDLFPGMKFREEAVLLIDDHAAIRGKRPIKNLGSPLTPEHLDLIDPVSIS